MVSPERQLWIKVESNAWLAFGLRKRYIKRAPVKTIRKTWANLTEPEKVAIGVLLTTNQAREDNLTEVENALPPRPDDDAGARVDKTNYLTALRDLRNATARAALSTVALSQGRALHVDPYNCAARLLARYTTLLASDTQLTAQINNYWSGLRGPADTPPPSQGGDAANSTALDMPPAPTDSWLGGFALGRGGQAIPGVYLRQNRHGQIMDRVCVKDAVWPYDPESAEEMHSLWDPDVAPDVFNHDLKQPSEIGALIRLNALAGSNSIIKLRNWHRISRNNRVYQYRMYLEWCSFGDLYGLSRKYTPYADIRRVPRPEDPLEEDWVPEAFLWSCLESLAEAALLMETGSLLSLQFPWSQIIHADLKPENIFLASNITNRYPGYPTIKLGDFGLANIISHDGNRVLPPARYYQGTEKCRAPEQVDNTQPVNEQTNVWGIGVVMWGLMNSRTNALQFYTRTVDPGPPVVVTWVPTNPRSPDVVWSPDHVSRYSGVLRRLVLECLEPVPDDRPSPAILLATIRAATRSDTARDRASGLRNADMNDERWLSDAHSLKLSAERYPHHAQLSLHMDDAPEPDKTVTAVGPGGDGVFGPIPVGGVIHTE